MSIGIRLAPFSISSMPTETDPGSSPRLRCPKCGATEARTLIRSQAVAFVRCAAGGMAWSVLDRRRRHVRHSSGSHERPLERQATESTDGDSSEVLWRVGAFACELRTIDQQFPAVLCVLKDGVPVLELAVLSALELEERANGLRILVERHQPK